MEIKNFPVKAGPSPSLHRPPSPPPPLLEKYIFFALPSMNGPLPAELKFRENIGTYCDTLESRLGMEGSRTVFLLLNA